MGKYIDETGKRYGNWLVLKRDESDHRPGAHFVCQCDCGTIKTISGVELRRGRTKSCGCLQKKDLSGLRFGKLLVLNRDRENSQKYLCKCDCGKIVSVYGGHLTAGNTRSCGQHDKELLEETKTESLVGRVFGELLVIERDWERKDRVIYWKCKCSCGTLKSISGPHLRKGNIISCGCVRSAGERRIAKILTELNLSYVKEKTFSDLVNVKTGNHLRFDFYVEDKYVIEFDGRQHFTSETTWSTTEEEYENLVLRDTIKNNYCLSKNIPIIRIPYYALKTFTVEDLIPESSKFLINEGVVQCDTLE